MIHISVLSNLTLDLPLKMLSYKRWTESEKTASVQRKAFRKSGELLPKSTLEMTKSGSLQCK